MTVKESLLAIKNALKAVNFTDTPTPDPTELAAPTPGKLSDGTLIEFTKLEAGGDLTIVAADGSKQPAPVGQYEMEDGTLLSVTDPGKIATVTPSGAAPDENMSKDNAATVAIAALKAEFMSIVEAQRVLIEAQAGSVAALKTELSTFKAATGGLLVNFSTALEAISSEESGKPVDKGKQTNFSKTGQEKEAARAKVHAAMQAFAETLKDKNK